MSTTAAMATSTTTMEATRIGDGPAAIGAADGGGVAAGAAARRHRGVVKKAVRIPPTRGWGGGGGGGDDDASGLSLPSTTSAFVLLYVRSAKTCP